MPRKNFNTKHGRRRQAGAPAPEAEAAVIGPEDLADELVRRRLASPLILDHPNTHKESK